MGKMKYIFRILTCESDVVVMNDVSRHSGDRFLLFSNKWFAVSCFK